MPQYGSPGADVGMPASPDYGPLAAYVARWSPAYKRKFLQGGGYQGYLSRQLARIHQARGDASALVGPVGQGTVLQDIQRRYGQPLAGVEAAQAVAGPLGKTPHQPPQGAPHVTPDIGAMDTSHLPAWEQGALAQLGGPAMGTLGRRPRPSVRY